MTDAAATVLASRLLARTRLRHLQVLARVAELGSVQRAASAIGMAQPSVTHVLAEMEKLMGCRLFERHARGVRPTPVAEELLPLVRRVLATVGQCAETISLLSRGGRGVVEVAAIQGAVSGLLAQFLPTFGQAHPQVQVNLEEADIERIGERLALGNLDLAFCRRPEVLPAGWQFTELQADHFVVVCHPAHPLAQRKRLVLNDLWHELWLQGPLHSAPRRALDAWAAERGLVPRYHGVSTRSLTLAVGMLRQLRLLALMPASVARSMVQAAQVVELPVPVPGTLESLGVMWPTTGAGHAALALLAALRAAAPASTAVAAPAQPRRRRQASRPKTASPAMP